MKVLRFILNAVWPFRFYLIGPFLMMLIHSIDLSLRPYLTKLLIDTVSTKSGQEAISEMANISVLYIFVLFIVPIGWRIYDWSCLKYEPALKGRIAEIMMKHLTLQSHSYFSKHYAGSLANKVNDTIRFVPELVTLALNSFIMNFLSMFVAVYALWSIHIWFAFAMSSWAAIFTVMSLVAVRRFSNLATVTSEASSRVIGLIVDVLTNISTVRLFAARRNEISRLREVQNQYTKATAKKRMFSIKFYLLL
mgnify:CR=1 FL=1